MRPRVGSIHEPASSFASWSAFQRLASMHRVRAVPEVYGGGEVWPIADAAPYAVGALDLVGDHDVGVQVRVTSPGVPVIEGGRDHPEGADLMTAGVADARADDSLLGELQR